MCYAICEQTLTWLSFEVQAKINNWFTDEVSFDVSFGKIGEIKFQKNNCVIFILWLNFSKKHSTIFSFALKIDNRNRACDYVQYFAFSVLICRTRGRKYKKKIAKKGHQCVFFSLK